jgi:CheY-like chemotaxis protein
VTKRILVVEDNPDNMYVMDRILTHRGYSVGEATSGADALRMIAETPFDLVLMDMQMPGLDGYATVQTIRELVSGKEVPIIAVTAHSMPGDRERTLDAGCTDYVSKPIQTQDLLQLIEHYLGGSHVGENSGR